MSAGSFHASGPTVMSIGLDPRNMSYSNYGSLKAKQSLTYRALTSSMKFFLFFYIFRAL
jgi:hypothetical protein